MSEFSKTSTLSPRMSTSTPSPISAPCRQAGAWEGVRGTTSTPSRKAPNATYVEHIDLEPLIRSPMDRNSSTGCATTPISSGRVSRDLSRSSGYWLYEPSTGT